MSAYKDAGIPTDRLMVGTGAAATADAVALTRHAAELGFAGALVLPPFYYKGVPDDGLAAYVDTIVHSTAATPIAIYLYHYPALSGLPWHVTLIRRLLDSPWSAHRRAQGFPPATWPMPARRPRSRRTSRSSPRPRRCCWRPAAAPSRAASRRPRTSMPTSARAPSMAAMLPRWTRRSRSASCSTARRWCPGSRRCCPISIAIRHWRGSSRPWPRSRPPTGPAVTAGYDGVRAKSAA